MSINHYSYACTSRRSDNNFRLFSISLNERKKISYSGLRYKREDRWANAVKAVISAFNDFGHHVSGLNFTILSEIPADAGRSRSEERRVGKECRSRWSPYH